MESLTIHSLSTEDVHTGKESACQCRGHKRCGFSPWVSNIPWSRKWQPAPVLLPGESHGQRGLVDYIVHRVTNSHTRLKRLDTAQQEIQREPARAGAEAH